MIKKIILWFLCIAWAISIFCFSNQPATESNDTSLGFTKNIIIFLDKIDVIDLSDNPEIAETEIINIAEKLNNLIRKLAHFGIYMIFGILVFLLLKCYCESKNAVIPALIICLIYAISDEIHQLFIPGRAGKILDIGIDFMGSLTGVFLVFILCFLLRKKEC